MRKLPALIVTATALVAVASGRAHSAAEETS